MNNQRKEGESRDKYVLNPSANSSYQLKLFEYLGILMACCLRTGAHLTLDLPMIFWKKLVGQSILFEDLEETDKQLCESINYIENCSPEDFEEIEWTAQLSDRRIVNLVENGKGTRVEYQDRHLFLQKLIQCRVQESQAQIDSVKKGLFSLVPEAFIKTVSATNLQLWVCGKKYVDLDLLKRNTRYSGGLSENSEVVKFLWATLQQFSEQERLRFVKFCWAQERLPANDEEFERHHIRFMVKPSLNKFAQ